MEPEPFCLGCFLVVFLRTFVSALGWGLSAAVLVRVVLSWIRIPLPYAVERWIFDVTEPVLGPIRRALPLAGGLDFSPFIALLLIQFAERILLQLIPISLVQ